MSDGTQSDTQNLLILASAGSGKTYRLSNRIIRLVANDINPARIMALTFTRKAAGEFLDSLVGKLAEAIRDPKKAAKLREEMELPADADFAKILGRVIRSLPEMKLATIDSFFARVVRAFQYELGIRGGPFSLLEGPREKILREQLVSDALGGVEDDSNFLEFLRRASIGKEEVSILRIVDELARDWSSFLHDRKSLVWGRAAGTPDQTPDEWQRWQMEKGPLALKARTEVEGNIPGHKGRTNTLLKLIGNFESHSIGSGSLNDKIGNSKLVEELFASFLSQPPGRDLSLNCYGEFTLHSTIADAIRELVLSAAAYEMVTAAKRTEAVGAVLRRIGHLREKHLVKRGLLGFNDIKRLVAGTGGEPDGEPSFDLGRELIEYRLDSITDHWLLDEFQDTSRDDWRGIERLVDEVVCDGGQRSLFVVGDRKQAIYGWRGGDVGLFDELTRKYGKALPTENLSCSQRSCPEVLELVNKVCGNRDAIESIFGAEVKNRWVWDEHTPADRLKGPESAGHSRVEQVQGDRETAFARMVEILEETRSGWSAGLSCGVLLRSNKEVLEAADHLRKAGFEVVEEGRRQPAVDHPLGVAFSALLGWLANPADRLSREIVAMSVLEPLLFAEGADEGAVWRQLSRECAQEGFACLFRRLGNLLPEISAFGKQRAADIGAALEEIDRSGTHSPREAAEWLGRYETNQGAGTAPLQVMTIHKAKGLGFDMVILPWISNEGIPDAKNFKVAVTNDRILAAPPKWVRMLDQNLRDAEMRWGFEQCYGELCGLYVALTRAKRGLYVMLQEPRKNKESINDLVNLFAHTLGVSDPTQAVLWETGDRDWFNTAKARTPASCAEETGAIGSPVPKPKRTTPTAAKNAAARPARSATGMAFGSEVHAILESVGWTDETPQDTPRSRAGEAVARILTQGDSARLFRREGRNIELYREQAVDSFADNTITSGVIDRLHILRGDDGSVSGIEIIDYKTDGVDKAEDLRERYANQMEAYRNCLSAIHPGVPVKAFLVSVRHATAIAV
jgi:ATP-dependent helicase/nuclease subunit A